jgi:hypothetical protein
MKNNTCLSCVNITLTPGFRRNETKQSNPTPNRLDVTTHASHESAGICVALRTSSPGSKRPMDMGMAATSSMCCPWSCIWGEQARNQIAKRPLTRPRLAAHMPWSCVTCTTTPAAEKTPVGAPLTVHDSAWLSEYARSLPQDPI